ncbi:hypothetical protein MCAP1_003079 [Malassezia caprae]|uniref:Up-regulated during septation protein 1 domain-containing protein n=1 Tax=Malassezia caprae TaxID=1381934 RepID=A0AAF0EAF9_9BASI|nr:hypothetical protein MCAP1_003079 [Malassezia caprae]
MTSPYAPSVASSSLRGRGDDDYTRMLHSSLDHSLASVPGDETQSFLDDLLITYSLLETEKYSALTLEQVGELRRTQAQLEDRMREMQERIALEKKMRHAAQSMQSSLIHVSPQPRGKTSHMAEAMQRTDDVMQQFLHVSDARHDIQQQLLAHHIAVLREHLSAHGATRPPVSPSPLSDALSLARISPVPSLYPHIRDTPTRMPSSERHMPRSLSSKSWAARSPAPADDAMDLSHLINEVEQLEQRHRGLTAQLTSNTERKAALRHRLSRLCEDNLEVAERLAQRDLDWSDMPGPSTSIHREEHERIVQALEAERARAMDELDAARAQSAEHDAALEKLRAEQEQLRTAHATAMDQLRAEHAALTSAHEALQAQAAAREQALEARHREALETRETQHREALEARETQHREALEAHNTQHREALAALEAEHAALRMREAELTEQLQHVRQSSEAELAQQRAAHTNELCEQVEAHRAALAEARAETPVEAEPPASAETTATRSPLLKPSWSRRPAGPESSPREAAPGTISQRLQRMFAGDRVPSTDEAVAPAAADADLAAELQQLREQLEAERQQKDMVAHRLEEVMVLYRSAVSRPTLDVPVVQEPPEAPAPEAPATRRSSEALSPDSDPVPHTPLGPATPLEVPATPHRAERPDLYVDVSETPTHARTDRSLGGSRHRFLEMEVDRHRRAAEQARVAFEQLRARAASEREASERERQLVDTWTAEWRGLCTRLEQQHHFCMRVLGKADGREEMDGLLDQIKASSMPRRAAAREDAGEDAARLLSQVEEHISDMAEGLARAGASGLGGNVIAQLEDRIEELETQLAQRDAASSADVSGASMADAPLDLCLYALVVMGALLPEGDALLHSMSLPLDAVRQLFAPPAPAANEADALDALRRVPVLDAACAMAASSAAAQRATGRAFAERVMHTT